jgi:hypothetical protein
MPITQILLVRNESDYSVGVVNNEHPEDTNEGRGRVPARFEKLITMWIPWCTDQKSFADHHIQVTLDADGQVERTFSIWQADRQGNDAVRVSEDGAWHDPGDTIAGLATVEGPRTLVVRSDGNLAMKLFEYVPEINLEVSFTPSDFDASVYVGSIGTVPPGAYIVGVANDRMGQNALTVDVQFTQPDGARTSGVIEPNQKLQGAFEGLKIAGGLWVAQLFSGAPAKYILGVSSRLPLS